MEDQTAYKFKAIYKAGRRPEWPTPEFGKSVATSKYALFHGDTHSGLEEVVHLLNSISDHIEPFSAAYIDTHGNERIASFGEGVASTLFFESIYNVQFARFVEEAIVEVERIELKGYTQKVLDEVSDEYKAIAKIFFDAVRKHTQ